MLVIDRHTDLPDVTLLRPLGTLLPRLLGVWINDVDYDHLVSVLGAPSVRLTYEDALWWFLAGGVPVGVRWVRGRLEAVALRGETRTREGLLLWCGIQERLLVGAGVSEWAHLTGEVLSELPPMQFPAVAPPRHAPVDGDAGHIIIPAEPNRAVADDEAAHSRVLEIGLAAPRERRLPLRSRGLIPHDAERLPIPSQRLIDCLGTPFEIGRPGHRSLQWAYTVDGWWMALEHADGHVRMVVAENATERSLEAHALFAAALSYVSTALGARLWAITARRQQPVDAELPRHRGVPDDQSLADPFAAVRAAALRIRADRQAAGARPVAYISGALNGVPDLPAARAWYEQLAAWCAEIGVDAYVPHLHADPERRSDASDDEVFQMDAMAHMGADVFIGELRDRSHGVGAEVTFGAIQQQPMLLLWPLGQRQSRYLLGLAAMNPNFQSAGYAGPHECRAILHAQLPKMLPGRTTPPVIGRTYASEPLPAPPRYERMG